MMYSVWKPIQGVYAYYEVDPSSKDLDVPGPKLGNAASPIGFVPEETLWALPSKAKYVGSGALARGMIAKAAPSAALGEFLDNFTDPSMLIKYGIAGGVIYGVWKLWKVFTK